MIHDKILCIHTNHPPSTFGLDSRTSRLAGWQAKLFCSLPLTSTLRIGWGMARPRIMGSCPMFVDGMGISSFSSFSSGKKSKKRKRKRSLLQFYTPSAPLIRC
ncbi:hypothetical protein GYMLUDRAFT_440319 [Collybiopsis luxurians FD-317 M1]|uniref:Unplaced genomic scaffold GYMLUscaffold_149, whole genome shotgun sequence n=1 Tax=Collybiopsis luxurians FD-317 M1 TaxID=944289 RepID=A0A0D0BMA7_9AGAR|nr:hypothetical protein GYMLUDRAFT_440319 [Collybiopsis luxurians FD-317 M1]